MDYAPGWIRRGPLRARREPPSRSGTHLVLLGTRAGPFPSLRAATSTALVVDGHIYLIDAGAGLVQRFYEAGLDFSDVEAMFITHLHSDHVADYFTFLNSNFANWRIGAQQVQIFGPNRADQHHEVTTGGFADSAHLPLISPGLPAPGIVEMTRLLIEANAYDLNNSVRTVRHFDGTPHDVSGTLGKGMFTVSALPNPVGSSPWDTSPPMAPVEVFVDERVRVTASLAAHPPVFPAWAYRVETPHCTVVFSGDTSPCENLQTLSCGADVLVNEVMCLEAGLAQFEGGPLEESMRRQLLTAHTPHRSHGTGPGQIPIPSVGEFATATGVRALVLNHIYPDDGSVTDDELRRVVEGDFAGTVHVGNDLDVIDLAAMLTSADDC